MLFPVVTNTNRAVNCNLIDRRRWLEPSVPSRTFWVAGSREE